MKSKINLFIVGIFLTLAANGFAQTNFTKVTTGDIVNDLGAFSRAIWADFNKDGWLDLFVSGFPNPA